MHNAKKMVAVVVVATALCAVDRAAVAAAPASPGRAAVGDLARQLATRLSVKLQHVVPAVRIQFAAPSAFTAPCDVRSVNTDLFVAHQWPLSPFQFRLPPPCHV